MKTAIIYVSTHHGNTRKVVEAIAQKHDITLIDAVTENEFDLSAFERIGFASGIAFGKFYPQMLDIMKEKLPEGKDIFLIYTCGNKTNSNCNAAREIAKTKKAKILGEYGCRGYDTYGPFKLVGGIAKNHPNESDFQNAIDFYENLN